MTMTYNARPSPNGGDVWGSDAVRWQISAERFRMIRGLWLADLEAALLAQHGADGREELGPGTIALSLIRNVCEQLSVLYSDPPALSNASGEKLDDLIGPMGLIAKAGLWNQQTGLQQITLAERECHKRVSWSRKGLSYKTVPPHEVIARPMPWDETTVGALAHLRWYHAYSLDYEVAGDGVWAWEAWDIRDPDAPTYGIYVHDAKADDNLGMDITGSLKGFDAPAEYPWRWTSGAEEGEPFIPWVLYHAEDASDLYDPTRWAELVASTKDGGCMLTQFEHLMYRAAHSLKWAIGLTVVGAKVEGQARVKRVNAGMTSLVQFFETDPTAGNPGRVGQFTPAANPVEYMTAIQKFITLVASVAGIDAAHIVRESADAWSGAALTVDRDGKREAQKVYGARFASVDVELVAKSAAIVNLNTDSMFPEEGYRIEYKALPLTPAEEESRREHAAQMVADGHWSIIDSHMYMNPGMSRPEAIIDLRRVSEDAEKFEQPRVTPAANEEITPEEDVDHE